MRQRSVGSIWYNTVCPLFDFFSHDFLCFSDPPSPHLPRSVSVSFSRERSATCLIIGV